MGAQDILRRLAAERRWPIEEAQGAGSHPKVRFNGKRIARRPQAATSRPTTGRGVVQLAGGPSERSV
jgi:hypothetical protein